MRRGGAGKRRDGNEAEMIGALQAVGAECWQVNGRALPDLIVKFRGRYYVGEVKTAKGKLTEAQGAFPVWRSINDALLAIGAVSR